MEEKKRDGLDRRVFLQTSAGAVIAAGCFSSLGLRGALAEARKAQKPLLTARRAEARIPRPTSPEFHQHVADVKNDLGAYLRKHFYLTPQQEASIAGLSVREREQLNHGLDTAEHRKLKIRVLENRANCPTRFGLKTQIEGDSVTVRVV